MAAHLPRPSPCTLSCRESSRADIPKPRPLVPRPLQLSTRGLSVQDIFCSQKTAATAAVSSRGSTAAAVWVDSSRAEKGGLLQRSIKSPLFLLARGREMGWRGYRYLLGMVLLVPTALILSVVWAWRRLRGGQPALEDGGTRQLRQGTSQELTIPSEAVGYVIGRQGQRVRELERTSGARIRFKDLQDSEDKVGPSLSLSLGCGQIEK